MAVCSPFALVALTGLSCWLPVPLVSCSFTDRSANFPVLWELKPSFSLTWEKEQLRMSLSCGMAQVPCSCLKMKAVSEHCMRDGPEWPWAGLRGTPTCPLGSWAQGDAGPPRLLACMTPGAAVLSLLPGRQSGAQIPFSPFETVAPNGLCWCLEFSALTPFILRRFYTSEETLSNYKRP